MPGITRRHFLKGTVGLAAGAALGLRSLPGWAHSGMRFDEYRRCDALELARLVRQGEVSPAELLELAIARTEQINPCINAVVLKHYDSARKLAGSSLPEGPFRGVPFLLKDLGVSMADTVTTHGSRFFREARAAADDSYVRKARQAGLVIFGKTSSPEFGNSPSTEGRLFGDTRNPWNLEHSAGGSSGGAAAAVAAGILPVAHASDGGGSIRLPASSCGLFGLKPSRDPLTIATRPGEPPAVCSRRSMSSAAACATRQPCWMPWPGPAPGRASVRRGRAVICSSCSTHRSACALQSCASRCWICRWMRSAWQHWTRPCSCAASSGMSWWRRPPRWTCAPPCRPPALSAWPAWPTAWPCAKPSWDAR